jgi:hypothetical protein
MNNEQRAELLTAIAELARRYPNWRLGQLVANVAGWADQDIWDVEDEQLLEAASLHLRQLEGQIDADRLKALEELAKQAQELNMGY